MLLLYDDNLIPNKDYFHDKNDDNLIAGSLAPIPSAQQPCCRRLHPLLELGVDG
jgi:hypothetical protein